MINSFVTALATEKGVAGEKIISHSAIASNIIPSKVDVFYRGLITGT